MAKLQSVEPNVADRVNWWLKSYNIDYKLEQENLNSEIDKALQEYFSKNGGTGANRPDVKILLKDSKGNFFPILIEYKGYKDKLEKLDSEGNVENTKNNSPCFVNINSYAVNGAIHYANALLHHTAYTDIISIWITGYKKLNWELEEGEKILNAWFWVSSTENLIVANVLRQGKTIIKNSAIEPHVMNLIDFMRMAWADIKIKYNHEIIIEWVAELNSDFEFEVVADYIEAGTYMVIAALASEKYLDIKNARIEDLYTFIEKLKESWVKVEDLWNDVLRVYKAEKIKPVSIQTNIFPGFPTDLQSPFAILQSQADGTSRINEVMFEGRLNFLVELEKMTAKIAILNPHEAMIFWPNLLRWTTVTSWDLRAGMAMIIAGLIATWETTVTNVEYIYRGYENFVQNLKDLWADITEIYNS